MQILKNTEQVGEGSTEPVDRPCSNKVKLFRIDPNHHLVEFGPFVSTLGSRNTGIFKDPNHIPARTLGHRFEVAKLVVRGLLVCGDPQINGDPFHYLVPPLRQICDTKLQHGSKSPMMTVLQNEKLKGVFGIGELARGRVRGDAVLVGLGFPSLAPYRLANCLDSEPTIPNLDG